MGLKSALSVVSVWEVVMALNVASVRCSVVWWGYGRWCGVVWEVMQCGRLCVVGCGGVWCKRWCGILW